MKNVKLQANRNNITGKIYTSASNLNELYLAKKIKREIINTVHGFNWCEQTFRFSTHKGLKLADVTKYSDFGFCSQAYGVQIPVETLKDQNKFINELIVWELSNRIIRKYPIIAKIAFKERGIDAFN